MAILTKVNGDAQPVFALDVQNGSVLASANIAAAGPVQPAGPKLDFFSVVANASLVAQGGVNGYVSNVLQAIQQTSTIAMYQVAADGVTLSVAVFPTDAFTTATFVAAVQTANAAIGVPTANVSATASFTTV